MRRDSFRLRLKLRLQNGDPVVSTQWLPISSVAVKEECREVREGTEEELEKNKTKRGQKNRRRGRQRSKSEDSA